MKNQQSTAAILPMRQPEAKTANKTTGGDLFQGLSIDAPRCPPELCEVGKAHWKYLSKILKDAGLISKLDLGCLTILCQDYARMMDALKLINEKGDTQKVGQNNYEQLAPWAIQYRTYANRYAKLGAKYGLTLRDRQMIQIVNPTQAELDL
jgi:P27 family predicted phage terminase small subunit